MELSNFGNLKHKSNFKRHSSVSYRRFMFIQHVWFKVIGLSPWAMDTSIMSRKSRKTTSDKNDIYNYSCAGSCYNILFFIINCSINFINYFSEDESSIELEFQNAISASLNKKILLILSLCANVIPLIFIIRQKSIIDIINRFENFNKKLRKFVEYESGLSYMMYLIFFSNFLIFGSLVIVEMYQDPLTLILEQILWSFVSSGVIIQYILFLHIITKRFERIHSTILEWDNMRIREDQGQVCCVIETSVLSEPVFNNMDNIINAYIELCDICDGLKNLYGLPIMLVILFLSAGMVFMLYFIILVLMSFLKVTDETYLYITLVSWIIFLIMVLTSTVTKTMKQVELYKNIHIFLSNKSY